MSIRSLAAFAVVGALTVASAQQPQNPPKPPTPPNPFAPAGGNPLMPQGNFAPPKRATDPPAPFVYRAPLPTAPAAKTAKWTITQGDLLDYVLRQQYATVAMALTLGKVLEIELADKKLQVTAEEIQNEVAAMVAKMSPGKSIEDVVKGGAMSRAEVERQGFMQAAIDKLYKKEMSDAGAPAPQGDASTAGIMRQLYMRRLLEKYEVRKRGEDPAPQAGLFADVRKRDGGAVVPILAEEGLDYMVGLLRPAALVDLVNDMADGRLATEAAAAAGKSVTDAEVWAWTNAQNAKYTPPFDWATICRIKGTSPEQESERWRRIQCWKRATGVEPTDADLQKFLAENMDFFSGQHKNVSHLLVKTRDDVTGVEFDAEKAAAAKKSAETLLKKAQEGVDFAYLCKTYSEDTGTATNGGALPQPVKKLGGALDPEFQRAAYALNVNEFGLAKSAYGWHVVRCDKVTPGRDGIDFKAPMYADHIRDEYETLMMKKWLDGLKTAAKIEKATLEQLWKLKEIKFVAAAAAASAPK
jgi:hypothetical protein